MHSVTVPNNTRVPMYVLSNNHLINGAAVLFYPEVKEIIAEELQGNYFVLPSSVHETLIVPDNGNMEYEGLKDIVNLVNCTEVADADILTGEVYYFDKEMGILMIAEERDAIISGIQVTDTGYDYTIYDKNFRVLDGGVYDNPFLDLPHAVDEILGDVIVGFEDCQVINPEKFIEQVELVNSIKIQDKDLSILERLKEGNRKRNCQIQSRKSEVHIER